MNGHQPIDTLRQVSKIRFEDTHKDLPLGTVCVAIETDKEVAYVFLGWASNTAGLVPLFMRAYRGERHNFHTMRFYTAAFTETVLKKFPSLQKDIVDEGDGSRT